MRLFVVGLSRMAATDGTAYQIRMAELMEPLDNVLLCKVEIVVSDIKRALPDMAQQLLEPMN